MGTGAKVHYHTERDWVRRPRGSALGRGKAPGRACENGFDCRPCDAHGHFEGWRRHDATADHSDHFGFDLPLDRLYHRGHTWVRPEPDGTLTVGLDDVARRLVGTPERMELPGAGSRLQVNGPAVRLTTRGHDVGEPEEPGERLGPRDVE